MARIKLNLKPGDQKPFTRYNARKCSIATAAKRVYGGTATATDTLVIRRGGKTWTLRVGADGMAAEGAHDAGNRVGARTVTLYGKPPPTLAEQAEAAEKARNARVQARSARKAKAAERAEAAEKARTQAAERPDPRQQARVQVRERPRSAEEERAGRERARIQEAEARRLLAASGTQDSRPAAARQDRAPQPRAAEHAAPAARQDTRQPRAIEPPRPVLRFLRNPFARPEPDKQPARAAAPAGRR